MPEARSSLLMSAYWKIPLQGLILIVGIMVFVLYVFQPPPLLWNPAHERRIRDLKKPVQTVSNRSFYTKPLPSAPAAPARLSFDHLKPGAYRIEVRRVFEMEDFSAEVQAAAAGDTGMQAMRNLSPAMYAEALPALGRAFGHTFTWSLAVIVLGLIAASFLPRQKVTAATEAVHAPAAAE